MRSNIVELKNSVRSGLAKSVIQVSRDGHAILSILESRGYIRSFKPLPTALGKIQHFEIEFGYYQKQNLIKKLIIFNSTKSRYIGYADLLKITKNIQGTYILHVSNMGGMCTHIEALNLKRGGVLLAYIQ